MSQALFDAVTNGQLKTYEDEGLIGELVGMELEQNARGWRIKFKRGKGGHGDRVMSLGYALMAALDNPSATVVGEPRMYANAVGNFSGARWHTLSPGDGMRAVGGTVPQVDPATGRTRWVPFRHRSHTGTRPTKVELLANLRRRHPNMPDDHDPTTQRTG